MQSLTVRNTVNMRSGYDTGAGIIQRQVPKGSAFDVDHLIFPAKGEIWAKLHGLFQNPAGLASNAYICVVQGVNVFCDLAGQPEAPTNTAEFDRGWNARGVADAQVVAQAIESLRK